MQAGHLQHEVPSADSVQVVSRRRTGSGPPRGWKQPQTQTSPSDPPPCFRCGKLGHRPDKSFFKKQKCRQCGSYGHIQRMCPNRRVALVEEDNVEDSQDEEEDVLLNIKTVQTTRKGQILVGLHVDDCPLTMELDTGASVSVVSQKTWHDLFSDRALDPCTKHLLTYSGEPLPVLGQSTV